MLLKPSSITSVHCLVKNYCVQNPKLCVCMCVCAHVYNYTVFFLKCKMQIYRQLSSPRIVVGKIHIHMTIVDMENDNGKVAVDGIKIFDNDDQATPHYRSLPLQLHSRQATVMFCDLVIIKNFDSINSRRPWPPILISHLFQHGLF